MSAEPFFSDDEQRLRDRQDAHARWVRRGLRGLWWRRTRYRPGFGVCSCEVCSATNADAERCASDRYPMIGSQVTGCRYLNREAVFAEQWAKEHEHADIAQTLMSRPLRKTERAPGFGMYTPAAFTLNYRERVIIATIIQWLGSNVGFDLLRICLGKCGYDLVRKGQPS